MNNSFLLSNGVDLFRQGEAMFALLPYSALIYVKSHNYFFSNVYMYNANIDIGHSTSQFIKQHDI